MVGIEMRLNGRKITSQGQLERELKRSIEKQIEDGLKKAAGPGVHMTKIRDGYSFEGSPEQIERMRKRLR